MNGRDWFIADKEIFKSEAGESFNYVFFHIVDAKKETIYFKTTTEFLNFMSEHGYDKVTQKENKYLVDYTFKKKTWYYPKRSVICQEAKAKALYFWYESKNSGDWHLCLLR